jgi:hypothetical protein
MEIKFHCKFASLLDSIEATRGYLAALWNFYEGLKYWNCVPCFSEQRLSVDSSVTARSLLAVLQHKKWPAGTGCKPDPQNS